MLAQWNQDGGGMMTKAERNTYMLRHPVFAVRYLVSRLRLKWAVWRLRRTIMKATAMWVSETHEATK